MAKNVRSRVPPNEQRARDKEAIRHFRQAFAAGEHWYLALLEAIALWGSAEEDLAGRRYRYLIGGEAFDWLLLAERLCEEVPGIPEDEKRALLFSSRPPIEVSRHHFRRLLGPVKFRAYLNFLYGVIVEEALLSAVEAEVRKEQLRSGARAELAATEETYERLYGAGQDELLRSFFKDKHRRYKKNLGLDEWHEFTYWLFKYRLKHSERARVASDINKGLNWLHKQWGNKRPAFL